MVAHCIGIDLGGTFIKVGLMNANRALSKPLQVPTPVSQGSDGVIDGMIAAAREVLATAGVSVSDVGAVGIGAPGPLDLKRGMVIAMPNVPGMDNAPIRDRLSEALGVPAVLDNDANAAAYGEYLCGAGRDVHSMVLLTIGTGIGSGIVLNGRVMHGAYGIGAEFGHMIVEAGGVACGCGQRGCLERYCSATHMAGWAARQIQEGVSSALADALAANGELTAKDINEARRAGDALAVSAWDRAMTYLAVGCVNVCRIFDPEMIVLAGGMTRAGDDLLTPLRERFGELYWSLTTPHVDLALSTLGADAGVVGAAGLAWKLFAPADDAGEDGEGSRP